MATRAKFRVQSVQENNTRMRDGVKVELKEKDPDADDPPSDS